MNVSLLISSVLLQAKIRETMENAFWDSVMESMKSEDPNFDRVIQLLAEMRDELRQMAPESWRQMIMDSIDLDILSQVVASFNFFYMQFVTCLYPLFINFYFLFKVVKSGNLDIHYLGNILEFALDTVQKLSSPAKDDEMKTTCQRFMKELADSCEAKDGSSHSSVFAMIKALRFVLGQIEVRKKDCNSVLLQ